MGTCFAPNLAGLFMGWWEHNVVYPMEEFNEHVLLWLRYIDDLFIIWQGSMEQAHRFVQQLGRNTQNLGFTHTISASELTFLDISIKVEGHSLVTSLYRKDTAGNTLLNARSCHPSKLVASIPYGEFIRARRNCSKAEDFEQECDTMIERFGARGYSDNVIKKALEKARARPRSTLLNPNIKPSGNKVTRFITGFNNQSRALGQILRTHWKILGCDSCLKEHMTETPSITYRRANSLRDKLCSSLCTEVPKQSLISEGKGFFPCKRCKACRNSVRVTQYQNISDGRLITIDKFLTCSSDYVIYGLICPCGKWYIGSTKHPAKRRILEHKRAIRNNDAQYPVARHYAKFHGSDDALLRFLILDRVPVNPRGGDRLLELRKLESKTIIGLGTKHPQGLNIDEELYIHLK